jgi:3-methyladenine DNA glycosylase Mpg
MDTEKVLLNRRRPVSEPLHGGAVRRLARRELPVDTESLARFLVGKTLVGEVAGVGAGTLVRALEPMEGIPLMEKRRPGSKPRDLARGPGRLATALGIDRALDGTDLCAPGPLWLGSAVRPVKALGESVRIGISAETHRVLRFYERGSPYVSGPKWLNK